MTFLGFTNDIASPISTWLGIVTAVPIFWFFYEFTVGSYRRRRKAFKEIRTSPGSRPGILIVDLLDNSNITPQVENYRMQQDGLRDVPAERIKLVSHDGKLKPEEMPDITLKVREAGTELREQGVDTLHLFYAGPLSPLACVGAVFANSFRVIIYQHVHGKEQQYENWGPLKHDYL